MNLGAYYKRGKYVERAGAKLFAAGSFLYIAGSNERRRFGNFYLYFMKFLIL
ncbi:MAG: hypothetical protein J6K58_03635 [Lachnospiraceae bacterium]|nr:hypothetical protein [Lachnospiraceae bacterium]